VTREELMQRADRLAAARTQFVTAMVVRAQKPTSVRPGDMALVLGDGTIEGFVGGVCAERDVRLHALRVLETGEPLLLKIVPGDGDGEAAEGSVTVQNHCLSGGALEIFLEPRLPSPRMVVVGETPVALALASLAGRIGFDAVPLAAGAAIELEDGDAAVVVASHGRDEEDALARALGAGVPYVGLVASHRRGAAVVEALRGAGVEEHDVARLHTPAGLDIGARTPEEIALSILAELVAARRSATLAEPGRNVASVE
jgi:xanthine dehydrogenase accessory factor